MLDPLIVEKIIDTAQIVDVVSDYVSLRRRGTNYTGLCPFHADRNPSFSVSPAKGVCKCFSCGKGGSAVGFIMEIEQLSYYESLRFLARKYKIELPEREMTDEERAAQSEREALFVANEFAQEYFTKILFEHSEGQRIGMSYFAERGFREETIRKFKLGYTLEERDAFTKEALKKGYKKEILLKNSLISERDNGDLYDRFRGRVIFPVHTVSGKVVAFGGRVLKKAEKVAKYVNSSESLIYSKSRELYGLYQAKSAISRNEKCYLVEGYTDVISMHQAGIENVVSSSGTALTEGQIRKIRNYTTQITVLYDGDAAGIKASIRGIDMLLKEGMKVKVVLLPPGEDPDSYAQTHSSTEFLRFIEENEVDFIRFKSKLMLDESGDDPIKRATLINEIVTSIACIPDAIFRSVYIQDCSTLFGVDESLIMEAVNKATTQANKPILAPNTTAVPESSIAPDEPMPESRNEVGAPPHNEPAQPQHYGFRKNMSKRIRAEVNIVRLLIRYAASEVHIPGEDLTNPSIFKLADFYHYQIDQDELQFTYPIYRQILDEAYTQTMASPEFDSARYFVNHPDPDIQTLAAELVMDKYEFSQIHYRDKTFEVEAVRIKTLAIRIYYDWLNVIVDEGIITIKTALRNPESDVNQLLDELHEKMEIKRLLAKELGDRIFNI